METEISYIALRTHSVRLAAATCTLPSRSVQVAASSSKKGVA